MTTPSNNIVHLRWDNHAQSLQSVFQDLYSQQLLVDVTLACHGGSIRAHKVVLSAVSPYFRRLFADSASKYPVVILRDVDVATVEGLLRYLYGNEVHVTEDAWQSLCDTAQLFGIAGRWFPRPVQVNGASKTRTLGCELVTPKDRCHTRDDEQLEPEKDVCMERQKNQDLDKAVAANQSLPLSKDDYPVSGKESMDGMSNTGDRSEEGDESLSEQEDGHTKEICTSDGQPLAQKMRLATKEENAVKKAKHRRKPLKKSNKMVQRVPMDLTKIDSTPRSVAKSDTTPLPESPVPLLIKPEIDMEVKSDDVDERENTDADTLLNGGADAYPFSVLDEQASGSMVVQAVCPFCFKDCKRTAELRAHIRAHTGEKPFRCDICNAPFARSAHLKRHRRVHTGERPFECLRCQKAFSRQDKLKLHMDRHRLRELGGKMTLGRPRKDKPSSPSPTVSNGRPKSTDDSYNSDADLPCSLASTPTNGSRNTTPLSATVPPNSAELGMGQFAFPGTPASSARPSSSSSPSPLSSGLTSPNSVSGSMPYNEMSYLSLLTLSQRGLGLSANDSSSPSSSSILPHLLQQHHQALQEQALQLYQKGFTASLSKRDPNSLKQQINNSRTRGKGLTTHESAAESLLSLVQQIGEAQTLPPPAHS